MINKSTFIFVMVFLLNCICVQAQGISYDVLEDSPENVNNNFVAVELMAAEMGGNRNANIFAMGANGIYALNQKLGVDAAIRVKIASDSEVPFALQFDAGGFMMLPKSKEKQKNIKVRVGGDFVEVENQHGYMEKSIMVPAKLVNTHGVRAGLYFNKKAYRDQDINGKPHVPYTLFGPYVGWMMTQKTNLQIKIRDNGDRTLAKNTIYAKAFTKYYVDLLVLPVGTQQFATPQQEAQSKTKNKVIGFRAGALLYKDGPKWYNKIMFGGETGSRPLDGWYLNVIVGYSIYRG